MKVLQNPDLSNNWKCPICGRNEDSPVVIIPIAEVGVNGKDLNILARQYHLDCISLIDFKANDLGMNVENSRRVLAMIFTDTEGEINGTEKPEVPGT